MRELAGVAVAIASAVLYDIGYILEKKGLGGVEALGLHPVALVREAARSRRWAAGFVAMLGGLALQVLALTMAPVSVVQPILAGGLIALAAAGSRLLGERLTRRDAVALGLVLLAVLATALSAHGATELARRVPGGKFVALAVPVALLAALAARVGGARPAGGGGRRRTERGLVGLAVGAGLFYGLGAIAEKAVATRLVTHGLVRGAWSSLATPYPWLFVVATLAGMVAFQVGLQVHPASLMASLTNVVSTVCALTGASVVFGEALFPGGWWTPARLGGFAAVLAAVAVLAGAGSRSPAEQAAPAA